MDAGKACMRPNGLAGIFSRRSRSRRAKFSTVHDARLSAAGTSLPAGAIGSNLADMYRRAADYVDRILRGAKAGELPVQQPTKFDFIVNLRTAKTLGLTIPQSILLRADEVIE